MVSVIHIVDCSDDHIGQCDHGLNVTITFGRRDAGQCVMVTFDEMVNMRSFLATSDMSQSHVSDDHIICHSDKVIITTLRAITSADAMMVNVIMVIGSHLVMVTVTMASM